MDSNAHGHNLCFAIRQSSLKLWRIAGPVARIAELDRIVDYEYTALAQPLLLHQ
jgi:hypothetical protein